MAWPLGGILKRMKIDGFYEGQDRKTLPVKKEIKVRVKEKKVKKSRTLPWKYIFPCLSLGVIYLVVKNFDAISRFIVGKILGLGIFFILISFIIQGLIRKIFLGNLNTLFFMYIFSRRDKDE